MRSFMQKIADVLRGGIEPRQIALAVSLGLVAGLLSGWNLWPFGLLLVVLLLNVPLRVVGQAWAVGVALSWMLVPLTGALGRFLLEQTGAGPALEALRESPWLVLCDLDRDTMLGSMAVAAALVLPAACMAALLAHFLHAQLSAAQADKPHSPGPISRGLAWLVFGHARQLQPVPVRMLRPRGPVLVAAFVVAGVGGSCWLVPRMAEQAVLESLSEFNQAEVSASRVQLSLTTGLLQMEDLTVADPARLDRDRLRAAFVTAQLRPAGLWRGELHVERALLENVQTDLPRQRRARPYGVALHGLDRLATSPPSAPAPGLLLLPLEEHLANWDGVRQRLLGLETIVEVAETLGSRPSLGEVQTPESRSASKALPFAPRPRVLIRAVAVKGLPEHWGFSPQAMIEITNVSSEPELTGEPTGFVLAVPDSTAQLVARLNLHQPGTRHEIHFHASGVPLADWARGPGPRSRLSVRNGAASIAGRGWATRDELELSLQAEIKDLAAEVVSPRNVAGVTADLWSQGLRQLSSFQVEAGLVGSWSSPRLRIDTGHLVASYTEQLRAAGQVQLAAAVDEQLARGNASLDPAMDHTAAPAPQMVDLNRDGGEQKAEPMGAVAQAPSDQALPPASPTATQNLAGAAAQPRGADLAGALPHPQQLAQPIRADSYTGSSPPAAAADPRPLDSGAPRYAAPPLAARPDATAAPAASPLPPTDDLPGVGLAHYSLDRETRPAAAGGFQPVAAPGPSRTPGLQYPASLRPGTSPARPEESEPEARLARAPVRANYPDATAASADSVQGPSVAEETQGPVGPPPLMELGYDLEATRGGSAPVLPRPAAPPPVYVDRAPAEEPERAQGWTERLSERVKGLNPWREQDEPPTRRLPAPGPDQRPYATGHPQAMSPSGPVSAPPNAPAAVPSGMRAGNQPGIAVEQSGPSGAVFPPSRQLPPSASPAPSAPSDTPWYQRFWR